MEHNLTFYFKLLVPGALIIFLFTLLLQHIGIPHFASPSAKTEPTRRRKRYQNHKKNKKRSEEPVDQTMADQKGLSSNWQRLQKQLGIKPTKVTKPEKNLKKKRKQVATSSTTDVFTQEVKKTQRRGEITKLTPSTRSLSEILLNEDSHLDSVSGIPPKDTERKQATGRYLAIDCEFVGCGHDGARSVLARVSIVNFYGHVVLDKFVKPTERVTDWRTWVSGVTPALVRNAESFAAVQAEVAELIKDKILVGHAIHNDLSAMMLSHPRSRIRDTSLHKPFRTLTKGGPPALKMLASEVLGANIQGGMHSSVEDAQATMLLFRLHKHQFDETAKTRVTN